MIEVICINKKNYELFTLYSTGFKENKAFFIIK